MELAGLVGYGISFFATVAVFAILALGLNVQWGMTGQINIGIAGFYAIGAYTTAILTGAPNPAHVGGFGLWIPLGIAAAVVMSGIVALFIGMITVNLRADYLAIATIGIAEMIRFVITNEGWLTHGVRGIAGIPRPTVLPESAWNAIGINPGGTNSTLIFLGVVLVCLAAVYFLVERAYRSPWGRVLRAIRDNENATTAAGKDVTRFRLQAFVLGSAIMGLAGALNAHYFGFISPDNYRPFFATFIVWTMLITGGSGNNRGALLGAVVVWAVWSGSESVITSMIPADQQTQAGALRLLLVGVLLQVVLLTRPQGILPERPPKLNVRKSD